MSIWQALLIFPGIPMAIGAVITALLIWIKPEGGADTDGNPFIGESGQFYSHTNCNCGGPHNFTGTSKWCNT